MNVTRFVRREYKFRTRLRTVEGLIGSHIPGTRAKLVNQAEIFERLVGALENVSITKRARPLCCRWKVEAVAVHGSFRRLCLRPSRRCLL